MTTSGKQHVLVALILCIHSVPVAPGGSLRCYSCDPQSFDCMADVECNIGRCFHSRVAIGNSSRPIHGCVSENLCNTNGSLLNYTTTAPVSCCSTTHCNVPVRLVGGNKNCSGRVEIFHDDHWGTVCHDFWGINDAKVVCRQAGCGDALAIAQFAHFGQGSGQIELDDVHCSGNERSLAECPHNGFENHNCKHFQDAGVLCKGAIETTEAPTTRVRLVEGNSNCSGRVEFFYAGEWGTVCDDSWDKNDAHVVCRQLGCGNALAVTHIAHFGRGSGWIWMNNVQCSGSETHLSQCPHNGFGNHNCNHFLDAGVICEGAHQTTEAPTPPVRLVGGSNNCTGRVEVFSSGYWGAVCNDLWGINDANVVCRELGCGNAVSTAPFTNFGLGSGLIWMDNVHCSGNEASLSECRHNGFGNHNCRYFDYAGALCEASSLECLTCLDSTCSYQLPVVCNDVSARCYTFYSQGAGPGKGCVFPSACTELVSYHFGTSSYIDGVECCDTPKCNALTPTAPPGCPLQCYSCDTNCTSCTGTVTCNGVETCFQTTSPSGRRLAGCVSKNLCNNTNLSRQHLGSHGPMSCCNTSFCNNPDPPTTAPPATMDPPTTEDCPWYQDLDPFDWKSVFSGAGRVLPAALVLPLLQLCVYALHF